MRKITFTEIGMVNYGPYTEEFLLECRNNSLTLITGPNGIGKTIGLDAMGFTFYGITSKGERGDDVVNNTVGKNCHTWVKFHDQNDDSYVIDRYHKHSKFRNTVHITKNAESKPYKVGHRECIGEIERLIGDRKAFTNTLMFGQKVKDFFTDLTDTDQKAIFWKLLDLTKYNFYSKTAKSELEEKEKAIKDTTYYIEVAVGIVESLNQQMETEKEKEKTYEADKKLKIETLQGKINDYNNLIDLAKKSLEAFTDNDINGKREKVFQLKARASNMGEKAEEIRNGIATEAKTKVDELTRSCSEKKVKITAKYQELNQQLTKDNQIITEEFNHVVLKINEEISVLKSKQSSERAHITGLENRISELRDTDLVCGDDCPTCLGPITDDSIKHIDTIIMGFELDINKHKKLIREIANQLDRKGSNKLKLATKKDTKVVKITNEISLNTVNKNNEDEDTDKRLQELKDQLSKMANETLKDKIKHLEVENESIKLELEKAELDLTAAEEEDKKKKEFESKIAEYTIMITNVKEQIKTLTDSDFDNSTLDQLKTNKNKKLKTIEELNAKSRCFR